MAAAATVCPRGDACALNAGAVTCYACGRNWPPDETWSPRSSAISLRAAAERVLEATPEERAALLIDLRHERAEVGYGIERARATIGVLEAVAGVLERRARAADADEPAPPAEPAA